MRLPTALLLANLLLPFLALNAATDSKPTSSGSDVAQATSAATPAPSAASEAQTPAQEKPTPARQQPTPDAASQQSLLGRQTQVLSSAENDYVLTAGDTIEMTIFREPDLTTRSTIARDGTVQLPLVQEVKLAGKTVRDARNYLRELYGRSYLVSPQVYLNILQFAQRKFTIMGQVARPGSYQLEGGQKLDILEAIGMSGGFTRIADRGTVIIKRRNQDGSVETIRANAKRIAEGRADSIEIKPGDIITVRESWF